MLKYYDPNFRGVHVVRATFMAWDYVGHVAWPIGGNCRGAAMLNTDFLECDTQEDIDRYVENDCQFSFDEESRDLLRRPSRRDDGDTLEYSGDEDEFKSILISMEICECREQKTP